MGSANIGWMFYKEAFKKLGNSQDARDMKCVNDDILNSNLFEYDFSKGTHSSIKLTTTYPGLVVGSGYTHALKNEKENFNFGFFFDHTTGMPIIPGSTVKGVLRSMFGQNKNDKYKKQKEELINTLLPEYAKGKVEIIQKAIFEGINPNGKQQPTYQRDIFLDAFVINSEKKLLSDDNITPHEDPFKDPVPNRMLKLAPKVQICFAFELHDLHDGESKLLSADDKEKLFLTLLLWNGIGAKTNVGYGQFEKVDDDKLKAEKKLQEIANESPIEKIFKEFNNNTANIVGAYELNLKDRVKDYLDEFKQKLIKKLEDELKKAKTKQKEKIEKRLKRVQEWV